MYSKEMFCHKMIVVGLSLWPPVVRICSVGISSAFIFLVLCFKSNECVEIEEYEETGISKLHHPTHAVTAKKRQDSITYIHLLPVGEHYFCTYISFVM